MGSSASARILIVEDDVDLGHALSDELALAGYQCELALNGPQALDQIEHSSFDAIISDLRMEGMNGLELLDELKRKKPALPVIIVTGIEARSGGDDAMGKGAFHYFTKPIDVEQLRGVIEQAIGDRADLPQASNDVAYRVSAGNERGGFHSAGDVLLPTGAATRALIDRIEQFATAHAPVLIQGESGTGKELVARALHERGARAHAPFIAVNTAAIPEHLLESELFGHARGAFSGAAQARRGLLLEANHGTILLDEIGDMPLGLQAKLLRVVQFGEVRAIGSDRPQHVDVRFLAATHRDLKTLAEEGKFRQDLFYRLSVLEIRVPALRERTAEIPALVAHFIARARKRRPDSVVRGITPEALRRLAAAPWPGNIRQLASTIERLVVLGQTSMIESADVALADISPAVECFSAPLERAREGSWTLDELINTYVAWTLDRVAGDKAEAARILGWSTCGGNESAWSRSGSKASSARWCNIADAAPAALSMRL